MSTNNHETKRAPEFVPERLRQARLAAGLSAAELASRLNVTRQLISMYEAGRSPSRESLALLSQTLGVDRSYFAAPVEEAEALCSAINFRALKKSPVTDKQRARALLEWASMLTSQVGAIVDLPPCRLPVLPEREPEELTNDDIEGAAELTRSFFGLGVGPISNLTLLLENHGVVISHAPLTGDMDGLSGFFGDRPIILIKEDLPWARGRFDLAHELGHLVLHRHLSQDEVDASPVRHDLIERQAHRFASALLLPDAGFVPEAMSVDFAVLLQLKQRWGASVGAMIRRLWDLNVISDQHYRRLQVAISKNKWRKVEPGDLESVLEAPRLLRRAAEFIAEHKLYPFHEVFTRSRLPKWFLYTAAGVTEEELIPKTLDNSNVVNFRLRGSVELEETG